MVTSLPLTQETNQSEFDFSHDHHVIITMTDDLFVLRFRMYMWNNIFFSLAFDGRDHYKDFGGDAAAHSAAVSPYTPSLDHTFTPDHTHFRLQISMV